MERQEVRDAVTVGLVLLFAALIAYGLPTGTGLIILTVLVALFGLYAFLRSPGREPPNLS